MSAQHGSGRSGPLGGPRSLKTLLTAWSPKSAGSRYAPTIDEAAAAYALAWERSVGGEIARRSRPLKFNNGVLTVLTASSAWSDELSLLSPGIIDVLARACPDSTLRRLRFIVASGRTRLLLEGERFRWQRERGGQKDQRACSSGQRVEQARPLHGPLASAVSAGRSEAFETEDVGAALARLAALQQTLDDERDRAGWKVCSSCGHRFLPASGANTFAPPQCAPCAEDSRRHKSAQVERALMQAPWLRAHDIMNSFPRITAAGYERARQRLLTRWQLDIAGSERRLRRGAPSSEDRVIAWSYLMLLTGLAQRDIGRAVVIEVLGQGWASVLFGEARTQNEEARRPFREKHK